VAKTGASNSVYAVSVLRLHSGAGWTPTPKSQYPNGQSMLATGILHDRLIGRNTPNGREHFSHRALSYLTSETGEGSVGTLQGLEGILVRKKNLTKLIISLEMLGRSVAVEIDISCLERLGPSPIPVVPFGPRP